MNGVRVIAGEFGGRILKTPGGFATHPMSERAKGALFNSLGDITGLKMLDAFAGSGALGLEALSRGAEFAVFVENDRRATSVIADNIQNLDVKEKTELHKISLNLYLESAEKNLQSFDLILADPPYNKPQWGLIQRLLDLLKTNGILVVSRGKELQKLEGVKLLSQKNYAEATIEIYRKI